MDLDLPLITFPHNYTQPLAAIFKTGAPKRMAEGSDPTRSTYDEGLPGPNSHGHLTRNTSPALAYTPQTPMGDRCHASRTLSGRGGRGGTGTHDTTRTIGETFPEHCRARGTHAPAKPKPSPGGSADPPTSTRRRDADAPQSHRGRWARRGSRRPPPRPHRAPAATRATRRRRRFPPNSRPGPPRRRLPQPALLLLAHGPGARGGR